MNDPTPHEKTRIRQLEDASAHWERKYANARQYNRNLEERIAALEARCATLTAEVMHYTAGTAHPRVVELEAALKEAIGWNWGPSEIDDIPVEVLKQVNKALAPTASETGVNAAAEKTMKGIEIALGECGFVKDKWHPEPDKHSCGTVFEVRITDGKYEQFCPNCQSGDDK